MPHLLCECGNLFEAPPGPASCPVCRALHPLSVEKILVQCWCGAELKAPARLAGKNAKCPKCGAAVRVPSSTEDVEVSLAMPSAPPPPSPPVRRARRYLPWLLALTLIPLVMSVFTPDDDVKARRQRTFKANPDVVARGA